MSSTEEPNSGATFSFSLKTTDQTDANLATNFIIDRDAGYIECVSGPDFSSSFRIRRAIQPFLDYFGCSEVKVSISDTEGLDVQAVGPQASGSWAGFEIPSGSHVTLSWHLRTGNHDAWRLLQFPISIQGPAGQHQQAQTPEGIALPIQRLAAAVCYRMSIFILQQLEDVTRHAAIVKVAKHLLWSEELWFLLSEFRPSVELLQRHQGRLPPEILWMFIAGPACGQHAAYAEAENKDAGVDVCSLIAILHRLQMLKEGPADSTAVKLAIGRLLGKFTTAVAAPLRQQQQQHDQQALQVSDAVIKQWLSLQGLDLDLVVKATKDTAVATHAAHCCLCGGTDNLVPCSYCCHDFHLQCVRDHPMFSPSADIYPATAPDGKVKCLGCQGFRPSAALWRYVHTGEYPHMPAEAEAGGQGRAVNGGRRAASRRQHRIQRSSDSTSEDDDEDPLFVPGCSTAAAAVRLGRSAQQRQSRSSAQAGTTPGRSSSRLNSTAIDEFQQQQQQQQQQQEQASLIDHSPPDARPLLPSAAGEDAVAAGIGLGDQLVATLAQTYSSAPAHAAVRQSHIVTDTIKYGLLPSSHEQPLQLDLMQSCDKLSKLNTETLARFSVSYQEQEQQRAAATRGQLLVCFCGRSFGKLTPAEEHAASGSHHATERLWVSGCLMRDTETGSLTAVTLKDLCHRAYSRYLEGAAAAGNNAEAAPSAAELLQAEADQAAASAGMGGAAAHTPEDSGHIAPGPSRLSPGASRFSGLPAARHQVPPAAGGLQEQQQQQQQEGGGRAAGSWAGSEGVERSHVSSNAHVVPPAAGRKRPRPKQGHQPNPGAEGAAAAGGTIIALSDSEDELGYISDKSDTTQSARVAGEEQLQPKQQQQQQKEQQGQRKRHKEKKHSSEHTRPLQRQQQRLMQQYESAEQGQQHQQRCPLPQDQQPQRPAVQQQQTRAQLQEFPQAPQQEQQQPQQQQAPPPRPPATALQTPQQQAAQPSSGLPQPQLPLVRLQRRCKGLLSSSVELRHVRQLLLPHLDPGSTLEGHLAALSLLSMFSAKHASAADAVVAAVAGFTGSAATLAEEPDLTACAEGWAWSAMVSTDNPYPCPTAAAARADALHGAAAAPAAGPVACGTSTLCPMHPARPLSPVGLLVEVLRLESAAQAGGHVPLAASCLTAFCAQYFKPQEAANAGQTAAAIQVPAHLAWLMCSAAVNCRRRKTPAAEATLCAAVLAETAAAARHSSKQLSEAVLIVRQLHAYQHKQLSPLMLQSGLAERVLAVLQQQEQQEQQQHHHHHQQQAQVDGPLRQLQAQVKALDWLLPLLAHLLTGDVQSAKHTGPWQQQQQSREQQRQAQQQKQQQGMQQPAAAAGQHVAALSQEVLDDLIKVLLCAMALFEQLEATPGRMNPLNGRAEAASELWPKLCELIAVACRCMPPVGDAVVVAAAPAAVGGVNGKHITWLSRVVELAGTVVQVLRLPDEHLTGVLKLMKLDTGKCLQQYTLDGLLEAEVLTQQGAWDEAEQQLQHLAHELRDLRHDSANEQQQAQ